MYVGACLRRPSRVSVDRLLASVLDLSTLEVEVGLNQLYLILSNLFLEVDVAG